MHLNNSANVCVRNLVDALLIKMWGLLTIHSLSLYLYVYLMAHTILVIDHTMHLGGKRCSTTPQPVMDAQICTLLQYKLCTHHVTDVL